MSKLLKADFYHMRKSRLTLIALILAVAFPVLIVVLFSGMDLMAGLGGSDDGSLFTANYIISSVFSLTNNLGLVLPVFAGIIVCMDLSNGTLRNKVIAGNRRSAIYLSHLLISMLFLVAVIAIYAAVTVALALLIFPFNWDTPLSLGKEIAYFTAYGLTTFAFIATVSTMLALTFRSVAPTIIITIVYAIVMMLPSAILMIVDYSKYEYAVYFIPTFAGNFFTLNGGLSSMLLQPGATSKDLIFAEGMLSYAFFGALHTVIGLLVFKKRDLR